MDHTTEGMARRSIESRGLDVRRPRIPSRPIVGNGHWGSPRTYRNNNDPKREGRCTDHADALGDGDGAGRERCESGVPRKRAGFTAPCKIYCGLVLWFRIVSLTPPDES